MVKYATLQKVFLVVFFLITVTTLMLALPVMLSQWNLEQRTYEVGKHIADMKERRSQIRSDLRKTDDPQIRQQLEQELDNLNQQISKLEQEMKTLDEEMEALKNTLKERRLIGLILLPPNLIAAGVVTIACCLRIRDEEEEKLFK